MSSRGPFSSLSVFSLLGTLFLALSVCAEYEGPICEPGFLSYKSNTVEILAEGDGLTAYPDCSKLREPLMKAVVEPSLQNILENWHWNTSEKSYFWGYSCHVNNVSISRNLSTDLPLGFFGWTVGPIGVQSSSSLVLPLGTICSFYGCYMYTVRELGPGFETLNTTRYIFGLNSTSCVIDLDECAEGSAGCGQNCTDVRSGRSNSYQCSCKNGYTLDRDLHNCSDVDECETGDHNCDQMCTADGDSGWFNCSCRDGFTLDGDGYTCNDIDECEGNGTMLCGSEETGRECANTEGSYQCLCQDGFLFNLTQNNCTDVDECATSGSGLCQNICVNTVGGYNCSCPTPWYLQLGPDNCTARDVCAEEPVSCGAHSSCVNSPDSDLGYSCVCDSGYRDDGGSCSSKALVHVIWACTLLLTVLAVFLLVCLSLIRHKYLKNKRDVMKKYRVLFKYQVKKEEVDPSHNPVPFTPVRKVSYTFSLVSTLETYDFPLTPTILEPDEVTSVDSYLDSARCPSNGQLAICAESGPSKQRELSPIIEGNEDVASVGKTTEENVKTPEVGEQDKNIAATRSEVKKGYLNLEVTNPGFIAVAGEGSASSDSYVEDFHASAHLSSEVVKCGVKAEVKKDSLSSEATGPITKVGGDGGCRGYIEDSDTFLQSTEGKVQLLSSSLAGASFAPDVKGNGGMDTNTTTEQEHTNHPSPYVDSTDSELIDAKLGVPQTRNASLPHPLALAMTTSTLSATNDGYIPSNFSTTSSGYGSEEGNTSSFSCKSRFLSASSYVVESSLGLAGIDGAYIPSGLSTVSSGYGSEEGNTSGLSCKSRFLSTSSYVADLSMASCGLGTSSSGYTSEPGAPGNERDSLTSQVSGNPPCMSHFASDGAWTHSDYVSNGDQCGPTGRDFVSEPLEPPLSSEDPLQRRSHQQPLPQTGSLPPGSYVDSVFSKEDPTPCCEDVPPDQLPPATVSGGSERHSHTSTGYVPYPLQDNQQQPVSGGESSGYVPYPLQNNQQQPLHKLTAAAAAIFTDCVTSEGEYQVQHDVCDSESELSLRGHNFTCLQSNKCHSLPSSCSAALDPLSRTTVEGDPSRELIPEGPLSSSDYIASHSTSGYIVDPSHLSPV